MSTLTVDALADAIASIEHWRAGPGTLAGELLPLIERDIAAGHGASLALLEEAFREGFSSSVTYNDAVEFSADECWQEKRDYFDGQARRLATRSPQPSKTYALEELLAERSPEQRAAIEKRYQELRAEYEAREAAAGGWVPEGYVMVPAKIYVSPDNWEAAEFAFGGPGSGEGEPYYDCTLWVGEIEKDDGTKTHGLHVSCDECPEEGSITLSEFPAAPLPQQPAAEGVKDWSLRMAEKEIGQTVSAGAHGLKDEPPAEPAGREVVAEVVERYVEKRDVLGEAYRESDGAALRVTCEPLPIGTKLYTHPSPVADAEALKAIISDEIGFEFLPGELQTVSGEELLRIARRLTGGQTDA